MSNDRVDTNRPEYSWIPFFEELALRLHEDGWRHRQPEIVAELQRMRSSGMVIAPWVDNLTEWIDPFSLIGTIRRVRFDNAVPIMRSFKAFFGVDAQVPVEDPITPTLQAQKSFLFTGIGQDGQTEIHWDLFDRVMSIDDLGDTSNLADLLNKSVAIYNVGAANLSGALFWIKPHVYLKTDTIAHFLNTWDYSDFGRKYLENLIRVREIDSRPFPVLNIDTFLTMEFLKNPGDVNVWQVRGGNNFSKVDYFIDNDVTAVDFGLNEIDMSQAWVREEYNAESGSANSELSGFQIGETWRFSKEIRRGDLIVMPIDGGSNQVQYGIALSDRPYHESGSKDFRNRRGVIWRRSPIDTRDLNLPGAAAVQEVGAGRDELLSRIVDGEGRGTQEVPSSGGGHAGGVSGDGDHKPDREPRVWVVHADGGKNTADFVAHGDVGIGWNQLDLGWCVDLDDIKAEYLDKHPNATAAAVGAQAGSLRRFLFDIQPGDWVLTLNPPKERTFYYGKVTGSVTFIPVDDQAAPIDGRPCRHRRTTRWSVDDVREKSEIPGKPWLPQTVLELTGGQRDAFLRLVGETPPDRTYTVDTMLSEGAFLERDELDRIMAQLERKQNLILQGPPGTGKTFLAKRLAYALMGERADERISSVQFHQSYAYEDFVGGYRPGVNDDQQLVFESRDGAFLRLCQRAREAPDERFVMLIDEINRGNLSRVFGELLMLIEADKRSSEHAVELQHRMADADGTDSKFFVPPNVYIIGTMNLADRSLTGMNVAMRRRFAFAPLRPRFNDERFATEVKKTGMPKEMFGRIRTRMDALNAAITDDASLGRQYAVGHSFFCPDNDGPPGGDWDAWYEAVVEFEIRPLLEEYWFDDATKAADEVAKLKLEGGR